MSFMYSERENIPMTNEHFAKWCIQMLGQPYWYGTCVYKCSETLLGRKKNQYPTNYPDGDMDKIFRPAIKKKQVCADCVGACKGYAWTNGGVGVLESIGNDNEFKNKYKANDCPDKSANGMYEYCVKLKMEHGPISTIPETIGLMLHMDGHVGYYIGGGYVVEWRGRKYGCVKTKLNGRGWKHWTRLPWLDYGTEVVKDDNDPDTPSIKPVLTGKVVTVTGDRVNVRSGPGTSYKSFGVRNKGDQMKCVGTSDNGWNAVVNPAGDDIWWISGTYSKVSTI